MLIGFIGVGVGLFGSTFRVCKTFESSQSIFKADVIYTVPDSLSVYLNMKNLSVIITLRKRSELNTIKTPSPQILAESRKRSRFGQKISG